MYIYFIGICGTAMGNAALLMRAMGHRVAGSDTNIYPPMSVLLSEQDIKINSGYRLGHLDPRPDLVVIGNAMSRGNEEVEVTMELKIPYVSLSELLKTQLLQGRTNIVVSGTHGKTTTSSLMAWTFQVGGLKPNFLIGGVPENFRQGWRYEKHSQFVVIEGDEYDTAFFDKRSKFLHYLPNTLVMNNLEFDHADIFDSLDEIKLAFRRQALLVPRNGLIIANADDENVMDVLQNAPAPVQTFGLKNNANWRAEEIIYSPSGASFTVYDQGVQQARLGLHLAGEFNVKNALAVIIAARHHGISYEAIQEAFTTFKSIKRRMERKGVFDKVTVYDDFAHHPTAIRETLRALRQLHPTERIIAVFEPRSNTTRRNIFQQELVDCFKEANIVMLAQIDRLHLLKEEERLNPERVIDDIRFMGSEAFYLPDPQSIADKIGEVAQPGDVVMVMSNGGFGGIHDMIRERLTAREAVH
ncbi:MAG TPA: UDP-N-acetylmuramate:L-alanyl-gamma-D-glutamyl-meso-diaminopimelate ligase [Candidatus Kapabacteria bacterium]|nr:UDP-N-acetylmuramate:L-alanyl-gamma-D-glutamyl-meso-diaminopimelate ligase [Candidatus Kapabacteria bacterium]